MSSIKLAQAKPKLILEFRKVLEELQAIDPALLNKMRGWNLVLDDRPKGRLGQCRYGPREIGISTWLIELNGVEHAQVIDTLRHEVAHVLTGREVASHGANWRRNALLLGAEPRACVDTAKAGLVTPRSKSELKGTCSACGKNFGGRRSRPRKPVSCPKCIKQLLMIHGRSKTREVYKMCQITWRG